MGFIKGLSTDWANYSTLTTKMYGYIVLDSSTLWEEFLKIIFKFSHLLIKGLIES